MNAKEKRIVRGYKCAETPYRKAMRRAAKQKTTLAALLEQVVIAYSKGDNIMSTSDAAAAFKKELKEIRLDAPVR